MPEDEDLPVCDDAVVHYTTLCLLILTAFLCEFDVW